MQGPEVSLEFLAKRLIEGPTPGPKWWKEPFLVTKPKPTRVLLGSPIYVAYAD